MPSTSAYPRRFTDDGRDVTVDLHGCTVDDALYIVRRTVAEATAAGRARVVVIHGASTTGAGNRTIKSALGDLLASGALAAWVTGVLESPDGGQRTLWLPVGSPARSKRLDVRDVVRRHG